MKVLIWLGCFFVATILNTILGYATGIKLGYIVFYFVVYFVAKKLCKKWDEHKATKKKLRNVRAPQKKKTTPIDMQNNKKTESVSQSSTKIRVCKNRQFVLTLKKDGLICDIVNVFLLIFPIILSIIALTVYHNDYYNVDGLYAPIIVFGITAIIIKVTKLIMRIVVVSRIGTIIIDAIVFCAITLMLIPFLTKKIWLIDVVIAVFILLPILYVWLFELYKSLVKFFVKKYYSSQSYKMRCYKKINLINEYREKGVITEEEFQITRRQIISKIK